VSQIGNLYLNVSSELGIDGIFRKQKVQCMQLPPGGDIYLGLLVTIKFSSL
jgi:Na+-translocating ferredoxin:NAD+ oxidoreductase RnfE subunit